MESKKKRTLQRSTIFRLAKKALSAGETWYLVCAEWCTRWKNYVSATSDHKSPGPVDNAPLLTDGAHILRPKLVENLDFTLIPEEAWNLMVKWYGLANGQEPIARKVIEQGIFNRNCSVEIYLIDLKLCQNSNLDACLTENFSRTATLEQVEKVMRDLFNIPDYAEVRLWSKHLTNTYEPQEKRSNTLVEAGLHAGQLIVIEEKDSDGTWPGPFKFSSKRSSEAVGDAPAKRSFIDSTDRSHDSNFTDSRHRSEAPPGLCGLRNLGNTCFMNAAIQCLSNVPPLTEYMLSGRWREELNVVNPLGMHGEIATSYAELLQDLWSGDHAFVSPEKLKEVFKRFRPRFKDYEEQDSQDFMNELLDGLHEDVNRCLNESVAEATEAGIQSDEIMAAKSWSKHEEKNRSIVVDLFYGIMKSSIRCPDCPYSSKAFEPYSSLSLPLPVSCLSVPLEDREMNVTFVDSTFRRRKLSVVVPKVGAVNDLQRAVANLTKTSMNILIATTVMGHRFSRFLNHCTSLDEISDSDNVVIFEVPVTTTADPDTVVVPVYMREVREEHEPDVDYQLFGQPLLVPFPRNSSSLDVIYNTLLDAMGRFVHIEEEEGSSAVGLNDEEESGDDIADEEDDEEEEDASSQQDEEQMETSSCPVESSKRKIFALRFVNSHGTVDFEEIVDDGTPVKFSDRAYLAADWSSKAKKHCYNEAEAEAIGVDKKTIDLTDCIQLYTTEEKLGPDHKWRCPVCNEDKQALKKLDIWSLPNILVIHLMRFLYSGKTKTKIDEFIDFPIRNLNMSPFIVNPSQETVLYDLISVNNHYNIGQGHCTTFAKHRSLDQWFSFDDVNVSQMSEESVVTKAGYVLIYQLQT